MTGASVLPALLLLTSVVLTGAVNSEVAKSESYSVSPTVEIHFMGTKGNHRLFHLKYLTLRALAGPCLCWRARTAPMHKNNK